MAIAIARCGFGSAICDWLLTGSRVEIDSSHKKRGPGATFIEVDGKGAGAACFEPFRSGGRARSGLSGAAIGQES